MKKEGFIPQNFQLGPSFISFALVVVGLALMGLSIIFYSLDNGDDINLGILPAVNMYVGIAVVISSGAYFLNRRRKIREARVNDEKRFRVWVKEQYDLTLSHDQIEQLLYYGATIVDDKKYVLHYEIEEEKTIAYIYSEKEWLDDAQKELTSPERTTTSPISLPTVKDEDTETPDTVLEESTVSELRKRAKELGLHGYSVLKKPELINLIRTNDKI